MDGGEMLRPRNQVQCPGRVFGLLILFRRRVPWRMEASETRVCLRVSSRRQREGCLKLRLHLGSQCCCRRVLCTARDRVSNAVFCFCFCCVCVPACVCACVCVCLRVRVPARAAQTAASTRAPWKTSPVSVDGASRQRSSSDPPAVHPPLPPLRVTSTSTSFPFSSLPVGFVDQDSPGGGAQRGPVAAWGAVAFLCPQALQPAPPQPQAPVCRAPPYPGAHLPSPVSPSISAMFLSSFPTLAQGVLSFGPLVGLNMWAQSFGL